MVGVPAIITILSYQMRAQTSEIKELVWYVVDLTLWQSDSRALLN